MSNYGESATIKKPEAGDVWSFRGILDYVLEADDITVRICFLYKGKILKIVNYITKDYTKSAKYIGKSIIANINDLFKMQNDT